MPRNGSSRSSGRKLTSSRPQSPYGKPRVRTKPSTGGSGGNMVMPPGRPGLRGKGTGRSSGGVTPQPDPMPRPMVGERATKPSPTRRRQRRSNG